MIQGLKEVVLGIEEFLRGVERPFAKLIALGFIALIGVGIYAFALSDDTSVEGTFYMRGDQQTTNDFSAYTLNQSQSATQQSDFVEEGDGGLEASWGSRIFTVDENGTVEEITSGSPVAEVTRSAGGEGIQSANYTLPETDIHYNDALLVRVYIQVGSNPYQQKAEFVSDDVNASKLTGKDWRVNYYTQYQTETGGPPFNRFTRGTFYWGADTFNSRIEGLNYTAARLEANQTEPVSELNTYPDNRFSHSVSLQCEASSCKDVEITPQVCSGASCTDFSDADGTQGLVWDQNSFNAGSLQRSETVEKTFNVTPENEGEYRIRFNTSSSNVRFDNTSSELIDVDVADINLTDLEHENLFEQGINEYETGDTIDFVNTTLTVSGGTAFNLNSSLVFLEPSESTALWGPDETRECGDIEEGDSCETNFSSYQVPLDAETGEYNFSAGFEWENTGSKQNETYVFNIVDLRGGFDATLTPDSILREESSEYEFQIQNEWSESISDVDVTVNCDGSQLNCTELDSGFTSNLNPGDTFSPSFNITTNSTTEAKLYDINSTVTYSNPNENKEWVEVENRQLKVSSGDTLVTSIPEIPNNLTRDQDQANLTGYYDNIASDAAEDAYLNWTLESGWENISGDLVKFNETVPSDERVYNNITAAPDLSANRGPNGLLLESNASNLKGDVSQKSIDIYANSDTKLDLNTSDLKRGDSVEASINLVLDTGGALDKQRIFLKDNTSGDNLGSSFTDSNGETSIVFEVPKYWSVDNHTIIAEYEGNSSTYTNPSNDSKLLNVHDLPSFENRTAKPSRTGFGYQIRINSSILDEDGVKDVNVFLTDPSGTSETLNMQNVKEDIYEANFTKTYVNGGYSYFLEAVDQAGYSNTSEIGKFDVKANLSTTVATDKDSYGPNEDVSLDRTQNITRNSTIQFESLAKNIYAEELYSQSFTALAGTADDDTFTHQDDNSYFNMTEESGGPPSTPDQFEGSYTYETKLDSFDRIDLNSEGRVTGGVWDVQVYDATNNVYDTVFTIDETVGTWDNNTICSGNACSDYVNNGELEIRVVTDSDRGTDEFIYQVDYQEIRTDGQSESYEKEDSPSEPLRVGRSRYTVNREYLRFNTSNLPISNSTSIEGAQLLLNVSEGFGTGEVHHTRLFESEDSAEDVFKDGEPSEANRTNPINSFSNDQGVKEIDVTQAVNSTFEAGKQSVGLQLREEGEDTYYDIDGPIYLRLNFTADSELFNLGDTNNQAYLIMRVQKNQSGSWENEGLPIVSVSDGRYPIDSGESQDLASIWNSNGGFNTHLRESGSYRVLAKYSDPDGKTLKNDDGSEIESTYEFEIKGPQLNLTDINHENLENYNINEFETLDTISFVNVTVNNSEAEAVNASIDLEVLDSEDSEVPWGPNSLKICGDILAGESCEKQWDNSSEGYQIAEDASSGTFTFKWNTTLDAENAEQKSNYSIDFFIHDVPSNFTSVIDDSDNRLLRNGSTVYNFTVDNPWSKPLEQVNVTANCDNKQLNCTVIGDTGPTSNLGTITSSDSDVASFNITTNGSTDVDNYDLNATVEYRNPGNEEREWTERRNKILQVRIPGSLLNITDFPDNITRGREGYEFVSFANNTYTEDLTNVTLEWEIPENWNNQTGNLIAEKEVQSPGELVYNNFTGEVNAGEELGEYRINESTENDQGRVDDNFVFIDVYADTSSDLSVNNTDPGVNSTIRLESRLLYDNGTAISGEKIQFRDEETGKLIGQEDTNSTGYSSATYDIPEPLGNHTINASYAGSEDLYLRPSFDEQNITVRDRPNVTDLTADPFESGFGINRTINATIEDEEGIDYVELVVEQPDGNKLSYNMTDKGGNTYEYVFNRTWKFGNYNYDVVATDIYGVKTSNSSIFSVEIFPKSSLETEKFDYYPDQDVNLTEKNTTWWNRSWEYRKQITVSENSGNQLVRYPVKVNLSNLDDKTNACEDLRAVENGELVDFYIGSCDPTGDTEIEVSTNVSASTTEEDLYIYYGNENASSISDEKFGYRIEESGIYDPGKSSISNSQSYNNGESVFRKIRITVFGNNLQGTVEAYNFRQEQWETLFDGAPAGGDTVVDQTYPNNPIYDEVRVEMEDTGGNPGDVSYEYNYTVPKNTDTTEQAEEDRFPSIIDTDSPKKMKGFISLDVLRNESGSFEKVETIYNDSEPTLITGQFRLDNLWNQDPFYTDSLEEGEYKARFQLKDPFGNILRTNRDTLERNHIFQLNPPRSEVEFNEIRAYDVEDAVNKRTNTSNLVASGLNTTLTVNGNRTYRIEVDVSNADTASSSWNISEKDSVVQENLNSSWNVIDIYYENETEVFEGGTFDGDISWNTSQGGKVEPGTGANFSLIVEIPNENELRDIKSVVNDTTFVRQDNSDLEVIKKENIPPSYLSFNVTDNLTRGQVLNSSAYWDENIDSSKAEYNSTSEILNNFTVTPEGQWTNYSTSTDTDWLRGTHKFRFWSSDANSNQNSTFLKDFDVYGLASVEESSVNTSRIEPGEPVRLTCRVTSDRNEGVQDYNVSFYNGTSKFDYNSTDSEGYTSTVYSSEELGSQDITCGIEIDLEKFFKIGIENQTETIEVAEETPPEFFSTGVNETRFFKTVRNTTGKWYTYWKDNTELESASLVRGRGIYSFTKNEYIHDIDSNTFNLFGALNGTNPINEGFDSSDHYIYGTWRGVNGEELDVYHGSESNGGWNNTIIANATSQYCAIQTTPVNNSRCQNSGDLVSFFALDETGSKAWDHVGENHGELKGGVVQGANGYIKNAYDFDGNNDYINLSDKPSEELNASSYTLSAWIKNPGDNKEVLIASNQQDGTTSTAFRANQVLDVRLGGTTYTAATDVRGSAWTHVVFTFNNSSDEGAFYVNGSLDGTFQDDRAALANGEIFSIGQRYSGSIDKSSTSEHFDGEMDNVRIYNRQLNQTEIQQLFGKDPILGDERRLKGDLPSGFVEQPISGSEDWSNLTMEIPSDYPLGDYEWSIYANDTSANINSTTPISADIWAWLFIDDDESGADKNPVGVEEEFKFKCSYKQGNGTGVKGYDVKFWDNNTQDGSLQLLGTNQTSSSGLVEWYNSYSNAGNYKFKCNATGEDSNLNLKPFEGFKQFNETIEVTEGETTPPSLVGGNYGLNASSIYKGLESVKSFAEWNESIGNAYIEYNSTNSSLQQETIQESYTANFTNTTLETTENWSVGTHYAKTYAEDDNGNLNDTLDYLKFDVFGYSEVKWLGPAGTVEQGLTDLRCEVYDNQTSAGISNYAVEFYDANNNLIGQNESAETGEAEYTYNTSDLETGEKTWSCRVTDQPELYYNASSENTDSETVNLVTETNATLVGEVVEPINNTDVAQNKTFQANISVTCKDGNCGETNVTVRYNDTGGFAETAVSETEDKPFYTIGSNPQTCGVLNEDETCYQVFDLNATGDKGSVHSIDGKMESENTNENDTEDINVGIEQILILNVNYSEVDYGVGSPGTVEEGKRNAENKYVVSLDENSNDASGGLWGNMSVMENQNRAATDENGINNKIMPVNSTWDEQSTCAYDDSEKFAEGFIQFKDYFSAGENFEKCYFQEIPFGKYEGNYEGTLTIKVNATN